MSPQFFFDNATLRLGKPSGVVAVSDYGLVWRLANRIDSSCDSIHSSALRLISAADFPSVVIGGPMISRITPGFFVRLLRGQ